MNFGELITAECAAGKKVSRIRRGSARRGGGHLENRVVSVLWVFNRIFHVVKYTDTEERTHLHFPSSTVYSSSSLTFRSTVISSTQATFISECAQVNLVFVYAFVCAFRSFWVVWNSYHISGNCSRLCQHTRILGFVFLCWRQNQLSAAIS